MALQGSLDTSAIIRLLTNDIPRERQAVADLLESLDGQCAVADIAITEAVFVLGCEYGYTREEIALSLRAFMLQPKINCNRVMFDRAFDLFASHPPISFEDCCLVVYAELDNASPLYTFDKKLAGQLKSVVLVS